MGLLDLAKSLFNSYMSAVNATMVDGSTGQSEKPEKPSTRLEEATGVLGMGWDAFGYGIDPDEHLYRRLSQSQRELPPVIQERALRLAWSLYESNPLAHGLVETIKDHVVGKGFNVKSADDEVQKVINTHWSDWVNNWDLKQHDRVRDLSLFGEQMYVTFVNNADGKVRLASMDPMHIRVVVPAIDNPDELHTIVINPKSRGGTNTFTKEDRFYRVIHVDEDPESPTYNRMVGAQTDSEGKITEQFSVPGGRRSYTYDGSCFFFAINKVQGAQRGRSDLLSIIDWLDSYDQILFNFVDRTLLMNCFIWDVTIKGANQNQINEWRRTHSAAPKPGTVNVHGENEEWQDVSPRVNRAEFEVQQKTLKAQVLSAAGLPPHWFGEQDANRASAVEMASPAMKRLVSRQLFCQYMIKQIIQFVIDQAIIKGKLPVPPEDKPYTFEVSVPEMSNRDLTQASNSLLNVIEAMVIGMRAGIADQLTAQEIFVSMAKELGVNVNLEELRDRIGDFKPDLSTLGQSQGNDQGRGQSQQRAAGVGSAGGESHGNGGEAQVSHNGRAPMREDTTRLAREVATIIEQKGWLDDGDDR